MVVNCAACPDEVDKAATPPSSAAILRSNTANSFFFLISICNIIFYKTEFLLMDHSHKVGLSILFY